MYFILKTKQFHSNILLTALITKHCVKLFMSRNKKKCIKLKFSRSLYQATHNHKMNSFLLISDSVHPVPGVHRGALRPRPRHRHGRQYNLVGGVDGGGAKDTVTADKQIPLGIKTKTAWN